MPIKPELQAPTVRRSFCAQPDVNVEAQSEGKDNGNPPKDTLVENTWTWWFMSQLDRHDDHLMETLTSPCEIPQ